MTSSDLLVTTAVRERLLELARKGAPSEVCGVLAGEGGRVTRIEPVPNVAERPRRRYELDPETTLSTLDRLEQSGVTHLGFYHSHPNGPAGPSTTDEARATWPGYVYAIVSLPDERVRAWRWNGEAFERLDVEVQ